MAKYSVIDTFNNVVRSTHRVEARAIAACAKLCEIHCHHVIEVTTEDGRKGRVLYDHRDPQNAYIEWNNKEIQDQRDPYELLSPFALAMYALDNAGCDCGVDEPVTCLVCLCRAALKEVVE